MNDQQQGLLVTGPFSVTVGSRGAWARANETLVFSYDDGTVAELARRPSAFGARKYRYRYEVDTSDHLVCWSDSLPSGTGGFSFQAKFDARWRVSGAAEVVRRDIRTVADGDDVVRISLRDMLWPHATRYGIEQLGAFADLVRTDFSGRAHTLPEGLTVVALTVRIHLDQHASDHLRAVKQQQFDKELAEAKHGTDMTVHRLDAQLQREREQAILAAAQGDGGLLLRLIAQDESKLHDIMFEMGQRHDIAVEQKSRMLKDLIDARLIQPAEAQAMWQEMQQPVPLFGGDSPTLAAPAGRPAPQLIAGVVLPSPDGAPPKPRFQNAEPARPDEPGSRRTEDSEAGPAPAEPPDSSANVVGSTPVGRRHQRTNGDADFDGTEG
ncbi:hypothetical protein AB0B50_21570 [Streptomyces sp. NPDC041068]|uniref:hypothetical protein n=1 Tax=Streptomyces sp. NPDC041068 TaxID=3155130 RepID=UPI0033E41D93